MRIAIIGYGKMGKTIAGIAERKGHEIVLRIGSNNKEELTKEALQKADVAIEFSRPDTAYSNLVACFEAGIPAVCGTTAWLDQLDAAKAKAAAADCGFIYASNFSIGVNIFFAINKQLARYMDKATQYHPSIHEIHHTQKLDAPSGTGLTLGKDIIANINRIDSWTEEDAKPNELPITSARLGQTPGTHIIAYSSEVDEIEIKHTAHSREGFARGALLAAEWLQGKSGSYSMNDVLGIDVSHPESYREE